MAYIVCTSNLDLVSFLFVPALYSTLKLEIFPFTCNNYRYIPHFIFAETVLYWYTDSKVPNCLGGCPISPCFRAHPLLLLAGILVLQTAIHTHLTIIHVMLRTRIIIMHTMYGYTPEQTLVTRRQIAGIPKLGNST